MSASSLGQRFPQVMELAPEVRLGLNVCGLRPERAADTPAIVEGAGLRLREEQETRWLFAGALGNRANGDRLHEPSRQSESVRSAGTPVTRQNYARRFVCPNRSAGACGRTIIEGRNAASGPTSGCEIRRRR